MAKKIVLILLVILIVIQFIHPARNRSARDQNNSIATIYPMSENVRSILGKACMDCHSNNSIYPWYSKIQPVDWWMTNHIKEGKRELNFDEFKSYILSRQYHKLEELSKQVKERSMPLNSYTWIHKDAILTEGEQNVLISWADSIRNAMKRNYPADSLQRKSKK